MANVTIERTIQGYIKVDFGDYFPSDTLEKTHYFPYQGWKGICTLRIGTEDGVEFHVAHEADSYKLCAGITLTSFMTVDSVDGVTPTSNDNLIELILNLIQ